METDNCHSTIRKPLSAQSVFCPWTSRAPLTVTPAYRLETKPNPQNADNGSSSHSCQYNVMKTCFPIKHQSPCEQSIPLASIQQSTNIFFQFLRLMQLFPDVHPATLHTTLVLCNNNFFGAIDKLLFAKKKKSLNNEQKQCTHKTNAENSCNRYHPYGVPKQSAPDQNANQHHILVPRSGGMYDYRQLFPLETYAKNFTIPVNANVIGVKSTDTTKKLKKGDQNIWPQATDFPLKSPLQCKLPIPPLSPISNVAEDLSSSSTKNVSSST